MTRTYFVVVVGLLAWPCLVQVDWVQAGAEKIRSVLPGATRPAINRLQFKRQILQLRYSVSKKSNECGPDMGDFMIGRRHCHNR
ncbi:MAG: hypothetical protein ACLQPD_04715 [Desulfomonilaceae bacterium]